MSNIQKAIMFAVGILFTVAIIGWGMGFFGKSANMTKTADTSLNDITTTISSSKFTEYDNIPVSGTQAINAIRMYSSQTFTVVIKTNKNTSGKSYNSGTEYSITDISDSNYIEPTAKFESKLGKTTNGTVNSITLTQQ